MYKILLSEQQQVSCSWYQAAAAACEEAPVLDHVVPAAAGGTVESRFQTCLVSWICNFPIDPLEICYTDDLLQLKMLKIL